MKNNGFSTVSEGLEQRATRKLQKPLRETRDLAPEQVVTYTDECEIPTTDPPVEVPGGY